MFTGIKQKVFIRNIFIFHTKGISLHIFTMSFRSNKKGILCGNPFCVSSVGLITEMCSWSGNSCYCYRYIPFIFQPCRIQKHFVMCCWSAYMQLSPLKSGFNLLISLIAPTRHLGMSARQRLGERSKTLESFTSSIHSHILIRMRNLSPSSQTLNSISESCVLFIKIF